MTTPIARAGAFGIAIVLVGHGIWFISLQAKSFSEILMLMLWVSPAVAAFVSAYLAPSTKILLGASMAVPAAILVGAFNLLYEALGNPVDFPGVSGSLILVTITLAWNAVLCTLSASAGYLLTRKQS